MGRFMLFVENDEEWAQLVENKLLRSSLCIGCVAARIVHKLLHTGKEFLHLVLILHIQVHRHLSDMAGRYSS